MDLPREKVSVLIAYASGTLRTLETCLSSLFRYDAGANMSIHILTNSRDEMALWEATSLAGPYSIPVECLDIGDVKSGSGKHSRMLDQAAQLVHTPYILTLDSDCFPVANGWLGDLVGMIKDGAAVSGILWPWKPPYDTLDKNSMEWRLMRQHCWNNTQVACQLIRKDLFDSMHLKFADPDGDDTGFGLMDKIHADGLLVKGFMPTCCPRASGDVDAETNRFSCVIYGDKVYHHGGASREIKDAIASFGGPYDTARLRVINELGAEWILKENPHRFTFGKEDEVTEVKMRMTYKAALEFLNKYGMQPLFGGGWV